MYYIFKRETSDFFHLGITNPRFYNLYEGYCNPWDFYTRKEYAIPFAERKPEYLLCPDCFTFEILIKLAVGSFDSTKSKDKLDYETRFRR
jgi:hypothetical protein